MVFSFSSKQGKKDQEAKIVFQFFRDNQSCVKVKAIAPPLEFLSHQPNAVAGHHIIFVSRDQIG